MTLAPTPNATSRCPPPDGHREGGAGRPFTAGLVAVVGLAVLLRVRHLTNVGFGSDEAVYAGQGVALLTGGVDGATPWAGVRAHPPLLGLLVWAMPGGDGDLAPRLLAVGFGALTAGLTGLLGRRVAGPAAGLLGAGVVAVLPYHVDVTRQVLVDGPMAACVTAGLLAAASWLVAPARRALVTAAAYLGVATLFKETAALSAVAVLLAVVGVPRGRPAPGRAGALAAYLGIVALYPLLLVTLGGWRRAGEYVGWQVDRPSNAEGWFYLTTVLPRMGLLVVAAAVLGAVAPSPVAGPQRRLLVLAVVVPLGFYLLWPTKGYPYLAAVVPPLAVLAAAGLLRLLRLSPPAARRAPVGGRWRVLRPVAALTAAAAIVAVPATARSTPPPVAGAGGVAGVREAARWLAAQPAGDVLTADTGVANIVAYYTGRRVTSLPGDTDRRSLNPAYRRTPQSSPGAATYLVWDAWSAGSDPAATAGLLARARVLRARVAHVEAGDPRGAGGPSTPLVVVFEVPG